MDKLLSNCACFHFRKSARIATQIFDRSLVPTGLKATQFSLLIGTKALQPVSMGKLAEKMIIDQTAFSRNIRILIDSGLVVIQQCPDRRKKLLRLSAKGERTLSQGLPLWRRSQKVFQDLYGENWSKLLSHLSRLEELLPAKSAKFRDASA